MDNGKKKSHKKILIVSIVVFVLLCLFVILLWHIGIFKNNQSDQEIFLMNIPDSWDVDKENIEFHDNGNIIYQPADNKITYDENSKTIYYDNLLTVYLNDELTDSELNEIATSIDGVVVGYVKGPINTLQIATNNLKYNDLEKKITLLSKDERVLYATYDSPIMMNLSDWENESDVGNEANPNGNDWWAEAIGAYTAWNYEYLSKPVSVGIVDNGFDLDHEDLVKNKKSIITMINDNSEDTHGTHVAGLICAQPNNIGIRGVVSNAKVICADSSSNKDSGLDLISIGNLIEWYNEMIDIAQYDKTPIVINNSWGQVVYSKNFWKEKFGFSVPEDIDEREFKRSSYNCIIIICSLLEKNYDNFIFVQSAGNGYNNAGPGYDISNKYGAYFCGITEERYYELSWNNSVKKHTYQDISDHVMIVGAYKNKTNGNNTYEFTDFSNYGDTVSIAAPGQDIYSTINDISSDRICAEKYKSLNGTSMSAPIVAGSLAYLWSLDPTMTAHEVKDITVNHNGGATAIKQGKTYSALNIGASVKYVIDKKHLIEEEPVTKPKQSEPKSDVPSDGNDSSNFENNKPVVSIPVGFTIQGSWKSIGSYGFGQAQPGATVTFNETNCNFYSPYDTYQFYQENGKWRLSCKNVLWQDVQYFTVTILDIDNIEIVYDGSNQKTVLQRIPY